MMYYMGKKFDKEKCKEYKKLDAAEKAAEKQEAAVFDENGETVADFRPAATMTDDIPEGALEENEDGSVKTYDEDGEEVGTATKEQVKAAEKAVAEEFDGVPAVRIKGKVRRLFKGAIRVRNKPSWSPHVVRAAAAFDTKEVTHALNVDGKPMYRTKDGYFITGEPELVEYIEEK